MDSPPQQPSNEQATSPEGSLVEVSGLGVFRMKDIQDALSSTAKQPIDINTVKKHPRANKHNDAFPSDEDSDCSWTHEEEDGRFYFNMNRRIKDFAASSDEATTTLPMLTKTQRRFVHATAQIMRLGHASLGPRGRERQMLIFKHSSNAQPNEDGTIPPSPAVSVLPNNNSSNNSKKRKRLPKIPAGFQCQYPSCPRVFDRASERKKHEQSHQPAYTNQFQCVACGKGFRYRKDLTRHFRVHNADSGLGESFESEKSLSSGTSFLTAESRVASDASLFWGWKAGNDGGGGGGVGGGGSRAGLEEQPVKKLELEHEGIVLPVDMGLDSFALQDGELWLDSLLDGQVWNESGNTEGTAADLSNDQLWEDDGLDMTVPEI